MTACIYALADPLDGCIYYVGQTVNLKQRLLAHMSSMSAGKRVKEWVEALRAVDRRPQEIIVEENPPDGLDLAEQRWIHYYFMQHQPLLNTRHTYRAPKQLRLRFPFSAAECATFPFNQWLARNEISIRDLARELHEPFYPAYPVWWQFCEKLWHGSYELTGACPSHSTRELLTKLSQRTGIHEDALLYPFQYTRRGLVQHRPRRPNA